MSPTGYQTHAEPASWQTHQGANPSSMQGADACEAAVTFFREYARERPEVVALWAFGIGFVLGWKIKPW
ncbi:MAG: hypothetical protein JNL18_05285 [Planctomycetaceae bacterium]|nr:hypothetical protein [Planctomycetaceae bacterium]